MLKITLDSASMPTGPLWGMGSIMIKYILSLIIMLSHTLCYANGWPVGCWDCRSWGAIRLLDDHYAIDLDPDGKLQDWGVWQYNIHENRVLIVWMESSRIEVIEKEGDKFYRQSAYNFGPSSEIEETKKIGK